MKTIIKTLAIAILAAHVSIGSVVLAQEQLYTQATHPDMLPELSNKGSFGVGVKTISVNNAAHVDVFTQQNQARQLTLEVWYPSDDKSTADPSAFTSYENEMRSGTRFSVKASAVRDVSFDDSQQWPLVVLSHGYTGYRTIMFYLGEHLASHGYVVVGIDHTDSINEDVDFANNPFGGFMSTLLNRSRDQQFVLNQLADSEEVNRILGSDKWLASRAGVIGYSMGAYGALNTVGACYDFPDTLLGSFIGGLTPENAAQVKGMQMGLNSCSAGQYPAMGEVKTDPKWQAMMAFAPWGGQHKVFSYDSLANITVPSMLISGDLDDISIYSGIQDIFSQFKNNDHYMLTYHNARHNIAPHPAPKSAWEVEADFGHYFEPAWSQQRLNHINNHFALAMMDCYLKDNDEACGYLQLSGSSNQSEAESGLSEAWKGFDNRYSTGMSFERGEPTAKK
jgi:predicted dienelactone hydrolase